MQVSVFIATSLDGFIARSNGALDWLPHNSGESHGYDEFMASVDGLVMGRNTFDVVLGFPEWPFGSTPVHVLSNRDLPSAPSGAVVARLSGPPAGVVQELSARGFRHLYLDGGATIQAFLEARLIQRLILTRVPVLLGSGIPLFGGLSSDIRLTHARTHAYPSGLVQTEYVVE